MTARGDALASALGVGRVPAHVEAVPAGATRPRHHHDALAAPAFQLDALRTKPREQAPTDTPMLSGRRRSPFVRFFHEVKLNIIFNFGCQGPIAPTNGASLAVRCGRSWG